MFGFAPFADSTFASQNITSLTGVSASVTSVNAALSTNIPTVTGIANTSLAAVSGTFGTPAIDFGGFSRITIDSVLTASNKNTETNTRSETRTRGPLEWGP